MPSKRTAKRRLDRWQRYLWRCEDLAGGYWSHRVSRGWLRAVGHRYDDQYARVEGSTRHPRGGRVT